MNYFELFDIPISLTTDKDLLTKKYFELQKKYHPDFFTNTTEMEQEDALETSSQVNKGFRILQNRADTIKYVLMLKGLLEEDEKYQLPPYFLMEVMELNENLSKGSIQDINDLEDAIYANVKDDIERYDDATVSMAQLQKIKEYYFKKKYLQRILDRMTD